MPDVTAGGELRPSIAAYDGEGRLIPDAEPIPQGAALECRLVVTGSRPLVGSLFGLGGEPIPWGL